MTKTRVCGYRNTGNICIVNYTPTEFITQPFATRTVNVQPFSVFTYEGEITLDPPIDTSPGYHCIT